MALTAGGLSRYEAEPGDLPLTNQTIGELLDEAAATAPGSDAVVLAGFDDLGYGGRLTYSQLRDEADGVARALLSRGLRPGDRVGLWSPNVLPWLVVEFAVAKAGLVLVPLNPTYKAAEVQYVLADTATRALFLLPEFRHFSPAKELEKVRSRLPGLELVVSLGQPEDDIMGWEQLGGETAEEVPASVSPHDIAQIQYTSGTTGHPKGAMLTHHSLLNNARQFAARFGVSERERWANGMPLFHTAGCAMVTLACVANRAAHCPSVWFDARRLLRLVEAERCTIIETVPTMVTALLEAQATEGADLSSVRLIGTGGAPVPEALGHRVRHELGTELRSVYGLTETSPLIAAAPALAPADGDRGGARAWKSAGPPLPHTDVRIVDPSSAPVPVGEPGHVQVKGYLVMAGYLNRPEATSETIDTDGWLSTGDIGRFDADGWLEIVDRVKDVIIRGGENIYPAEIEALISSHSAVAEVCVVGVPDDYYGEEACAVIRTVPGETLDAEELLRYLQGQVTHQKVPRYVRFVDEFPTTASGKIRKREVAEMVRSVAAGQ